MSASSKAESGNVTQSEAVSVEAEAASEQKDRGDDKKKNGRLSKESISERTGKWDKKDINRGIILTISLCAVVVFMMLIDKVPIVFNVIGKLVGALTPFIIGCGIAFLLNPVVKALTKPIRKLTLKMCKTEKKAQTLANTISVIVTILLFVALIIMLLAIVLPQLKDSIVRLYEKIPTYINNAQEWIKKVLKNSPEIEKIVSNYLTNFEDTLSKLLNNTLIPNMDTILAKVGSGIVDGLKILIDIFVGLVVSIYIMIDKENLKAKCKQLIYSNFKKERGNKILDGLEYVNRVFGGFINGKIVDSIVVGVITGIFCGMVNMPYAMLVAVLIGVTNVIPFFGPFIGAIPSALLILVEDPKMALIFIIFILVLQQLDANIVQPVVLGDSTGLSGLGVLLAIMVGSNLFGIVGMILAVPVFAIIYTVLGSLLRSKLKRRGLTEKTEYYVGLYGFDEDGNPIRGQRVKVQKEEKKYHYLLGFLNKRKKKELPKNDEVTKGYPESEGDSVISEDDDQADNGPKDGPEESKGNEPKGNKPQNNRNRNTGSGNKTESKKK